MAAGGATERGRSKRRVHLRSGADVMKRATRRAEVATRRAEVMKRATQGADGANQNASLNLGAVVERGNHSA